MVEGGEGPDDVGVMEAFGNGNLALGIRGRVLRNVHDLERNGSALVIGRMDAPVTSTINEPTDGQRATHLGAQRATVSNVCHDDGEEEPRSRKERGSEGLAHACPLSARRSGTGAKERI